MEALARILDRVSTVVNTAATVVACAGVAVMIAAAAWQVVARYVLFQPPVWTEELARYAMIWAGMMGATVAFRARTDPTLFPQARDWRGPHGMTAAAIRLLSVVLLATPVLWYSFVGPTGSSASGFLARTAVRQAEMIDVSMVWFTAAIPLAFAILALHAVTDFVVRLTAARTLRETAE